MAKPNFTDIDELVAREDPAAMAQARFDLAKSLAEKVGMRLVPEKPTVAMLRPFMGCPDDELELAYNAMLHLAQLQYPKGNNT